MSNIVDQILDGQDTLVDMVRNSGKSLAAEGYLGRQADGDIGPAKLEARQRVFNHFAQHDLQKPRFFTLTNPSWALEMQLFNEWRSRAEAATTRGERRLHEWGFAFFVAAENNLSLLFRGMPHMPRYKMTGYAHEAGWRKFESLNARYLKSSGSRAIYMDVNDMMTVKPEDFHSHPRHEKPGEEWLSIFRACFGKWDAVWLDHTACLFDGMLNALRRTHEWINPEAEVVPIVVTLLKGRERNDRKSKFTQILLREAGGDRYQALEWLLNRSDTHEFVVTDTWDYMDTSPMCNLFGEYRKK